VLVRKPRVLVLLVHVHGPAEDDERVEALWILRRRSLRDVPFQEVVAALAEDVCKEAGRAVVLMGEAESPHSASLGKKRRPPTVVWASAVGRRGTCRTRVAKS
jgi:hypothetical protein